MKDADRARFPGWGKGRNDAADYAKLASLLGPRLLPVTPDGRKALHIPGQIPLWAGAPRIGPGLEVDEEATTS
jgi:hypothetical protein